MAKLVISPPGTNPMETPEAYKQKRASMIRIAVIVLGGVLALGVVCGLPVYFLIKSQTAAAAGLKITPTATQSPTAPAPSPSPSVTPFFTITAALAPSQSPTAPDLARIPTAGPSQTPSPSQTALVITREVTRIISQPGQPYPAVTFQVITVMVPIHQTQIVTATAQPLPPTQTPWVMEVTREVTREVTPTETPSPTPTETPTAPPTAPAITQ